MRETGRRAGKLRRLKRVYIEREIREAAEALRKAEDVVAAAHARGFGAARHPPAVSWGRYDAALAATVPLLARGGLYVSKTPCLAEMNPLIPYLAVPLMRAIGKAPAVLCFDEHRLTSAMAQQGLHIVCTERHGRRGKDIRAFVVARKPG